MKLEIRDGELYITEVYSGVGIETDMGIFGIAQRDDGIEVMLDDKTVWTSHEIVLSPNGFGIRLPDGSGAFVASLTLPKHHWLYDEGREEPPAPLRIDAGKQRDALASQVREAARYAIRRSTMNGKEPDFDPDAVVQNMVVGMLGPRTEDGYSSA